MQRLTVKQDEGGYTLAPGQEAAALDRLGRLEDLAQATRDEHDQLAAELERLRGQNKQKSLRFRELLGKKLLNSQLLTLLRLYGVE